MYERLILCDYAIADLTSANANVFYELGVRHAVRPASTALIFAEGFGSLPFDVNGLRGLPYQLGTKGRPTQAEIDSQALTDYLRACHEAEIDAQTDSPVYQLLQDFPDIQHLKTDVFRDQVHYSEKIRNELAHARDLCDKDRQAAVDAVNAVLVSITSLEDEEPGVIIDLLLSYRAVEGWQNMVELVETLPRMLSDTVLVQEQYGLALNRAGRDEEAERVLNQLIDKHGPSSETYAILGRVYKDRWDVCKHQGSKVLAEGLLHKAIETYLKGFETDWRDAYPGINALNLMEQTSPPDPRRLQLNSVVRFAVERRIASGHPDYWDYATLLELAVLDSDSTLASSSLSNALALLREPWEAESTARNITLVRELRKQKGEDTGWLDEIITLLESAGEAGE